MSKIEKAYELIEVAAKTKSKIEKTGKNEECENRVAIPREKMVGKWVRSRCEKTW